MTLARTDITVEMVCALRKRGCSVEVIARELHCSTYTVHDRLVRAQMTQPICPGTRVPDIDDPATRERWSKSFLSPEQFAGLEMVGE